MSTTLGMTAPHTLTQMTVNTALTQKTWDNTKLHMESVQGDPMIGDDDLINPIKVGTGANIVPLDPSKLIYNVTPKAPVGKAAQGTELIFLKSFSGAPIEGNASKLIGNEGYLAMKRAYVQANDWCQGILEQKYGIDFRLLSNYGIYDKIPTLLGQWLSEVRGWYLRQAFMTRYSNNLTAAPISVTARLTGNWYIAGLAAASQPSYDAVQQTQLNALGSAMAAGQGTSCHLSVPECLKIINYMRYTKYIPGRQIGSRNMYIAYLSPTEMRIMRDPSTSYGWGAMYNLVTKTEDLEKVVPPGSIIIGNELALVEDPRWVTLTLSGSSSVYTGTFGYLKYGRTSTRTTSVGDGYLNGNIFTGSGGIALYEPEPPHTEEQYDDYKRFKGDGLFGSMGYTAIEWNVDDASADSSTQQAESFMNVLTTRV